MGARSIDERGQATPFLVVLLLATAVAVIALGRLGATADEAARARTAADAAALAGALEGRPGAVALAGANGAELRSFVQVGDEVEVRVQIGATTAVARAARREVWVSPP